MRFIFAISLQVACTDDPDADDVSWDVRLEEGT